MISRLFKSKSPTHSDTTSVKKATGEIEAGQSNNVCILEATECSCKGWEFVSWVGPFAGLNSEAKTGGGSG
jgi:hypothetical protein